MKFMKNMLIFNVEQSHFSYNKSLDVHKIPTVSIWNKPHPFFYKSKVVYKTSNFPCQCNYNLFHSIGETYSNWSKHGWRIFKLVFRDQRMVDGACNLAIWHRTHYLHPSNKRCIGNNRALYTGNFDQTFLMCKICKR